MRPVFCGNFDYETRHSDLERLFSRYGRVDRIDMKSGERGGPRHRDGSRSMANARPTKTLFVINFDPITTRTRDIERHFEPYGKVLNVRIRRNFAFVQFETQEEATKALECTNMSKILDRVVSVEYALRDDGEREVRGFMPVMAINWQATRSWEDSAVGSGCSSTRGGGKITAGSLRRNAGAVDGGMTIGGGGGDGERKGPPVTVVERDGVLYIDGEAESWDDGGRRSLARQGHCERARVIERN
ncbi:uncharacterized protein A4U43_C04F34190 [Asparagus officinalis]|uniref:RRM domain-containing protein n=1 Tax=Asparagus officinalis TaxID=4686 RepID=A0A5P1F7H7_ASPOF|nr:uncharacterized protein A4U43_C04F34190 [Asparagus officinalis]